MKKWQDFITHQNAEFNKLESAGICINLVHNALPLLRK